MSVYKGSNSVTGYQLVEVVYLFTVEFKWKFNSSLNGLELYMHFVGLHMALHGDEDNSNI